MIYQQFMDDIENGIVKLPKASMFESIWAKVLRFQDEKKIYLENGFTRENLLDLFTFMEVRRSNTFANYKSVVMKYVKYLVDNGHISADHIKTLSDISFDNIPVNGDKIQYFKNLAELQKSISATLEVYSKGGSKDVTILDTQTTILYLAWFGFTEQEIIEVKKSDVCDNGVMKNGHLIVMPESVIKAIKRYRDSEGYKRMGRAMYTCSYKMSSYLVRSCDVEQLNVELLHAALYRMNAICKKKHSLTFSVVHTSGQFFRVLMDELNGTISLKTMTPEQCGAYLGEEMDKIKFTDFSMNYDLYKRHFQ